MKILFSLLFLIFSEFISLGQTKIVGAPINVAARLINDSTVEQMAETCRYYNLKEAEPEADFTVFIHSDGTKLRFKVIGVEGDSFPVIEVITIEKRKKIEAALNDIGFKKNHNGYIRERKYSTLYTICDVSYSKPSILVFQKKRR